VGIIFEETPMPQIALSDDVYSRLIAFQQVRKAVLEDDEEWSVDQLAEMLICSGIDSSLTGLWEQQDKTVLIQTLQHLSVRHPEQVYALVAEVLNAGRDALQEETPRPFGFHPSGSLEE
jgi:hypothetical protein